MISVLCGMVMQLTSVALVAGQVYIKSVEVLDKYMRASDPQVVQNAYARYIEEVDRIPIPSEKAILNTFDKPSGRSEAVRY